MRSATGQNPLCDLSGLTVDNFVALAGQPYGGNLPSHTRLVHGQCIAVFWRELQSRTHPFPPATHAYTGLHCWLSYLHSEDLGRGTSQAPPSLPRPPWVGGRRGLLEVLFLVLTQDLSTPSPSFLFPWPTGP